MTAGLLIVVAIAALACPAHMLWAMRRGKPAACHPRRERSSIDALQARQRALGAELARRSASADGPSGARGEASL